MSFHYVDEIPDFPEEELGSKFVFETDDGFKMVVDYVSADIYATECVWCDNPFEAYIPPTVIELFKGFKGRKLSELSAEGRLEKLNDFFLAHQTQISRLTQETTHGGSQLQLYEPLYQVGSYPARPDLMRKLPLGTSVAVSSGGHSTLTRITEIAVLADDALYTLELQDTVGPLQSIWAVLAGKDKKLRVRASDLSPSQEKNLVLFDIGGGWSLWNHVDWMLFSTMCSTAISGYLGGSFTSIALPAAYVGARAWVGPWTFILQKLGFTTMNQIRNLPALRVAGGPYTRLTNTLGFYASPYSTAIVGGVVGLIRVIPSISAFGWSAYDNSVQIRGTVSQAGTELAVGAGGAILGAGRAAITTARYVWKGGTQLLSDGADMVKEKVLTPIIYGTKTIVLAAGAILVLGIVFQLVE